MSKNSYKEPLFRESQYKMLNVENALAMVLKEASPLPPSYKSLPDCLNSVLLEDVFAKEDFPPFRASVMDGYAIISSDGPGIS